MLDGQHTLRLQDRFNGVDDGLITRATAVIARDQVSDLIAVGVGVVAHDIQRRDQHARRTESALEGVVLQEGLLQSGQIAHCIIDSKAIGRFMPPVFPGVKADSLPELAQKLGLDVDTFMANLDAYNRSCKVGHFDHTALDDCHTEGLTPAKTHWALPIDTPPYYGYTLRPGVTFTYLGLQSDAQAGVYFGGRRSANLFAAGEIMAGHVLGQGDTAGVGMTIGTTFGRIAGARAATAAARQATAAERQATAAARQATAAARQATAAARQSQTHTRGAA